MISTDRSLIIPLLDQLIDVINNSQQYEEKKASRDAEPELSPAHEPKSATCALSEILEMSEVSDFAKKYYGKLLPTILIRVGSANGCHRDPPAA